MPHCLRALVLALALATTSHCFDGFAAAAPSRCAGDCDGDRNVSVDELVLAADVLLGNTGAAPCAALDCDEAEGPTPACLTEAAGHALAGCPSAVASPFVEGPVSGGLGRPFVASTTFDLAEVGYVEEEFFLSGTASAYTNVGPLPVDGRWTVTPAASAAYRTRILVYRPLAPERFNGTAVVEWLNVSGALDAAPDWTLAHTELVRSGYAWVGVSAQQVGVEGGSSPFGLPPRPLKTVDPERYASLDHPGDSFSYDIFSQAAEALRHPRGAAPLGGLRVVRLIGAGDSQSAFRLVTYVNAVQPLARVYDAFLVHSRGSIGAALSEAPEPAVGVPGTARIRDDGDVPVLIFETESDLAILLYIPARQVDSDWVRLWEVAGTAHADTYSLSVGSTDLGDSPEVANLVLTTMPVPGISCPRAINSGPQHFVLKAAIAALDRWVRSGVAPASAPRLQLTPGGTTIAREARGNALGGIRTPPLDVPIAALSGEGQSGSLLCLLFGTTVPFSEETLAVLYPSHDAYVAAHDEAADRAVADGFILPADAELMKAAAASSGVP